ncbi:2'-5' RNA ligase family protein [Pontibacillus marinus]|uniref:2'-5' RNA ligase n=1 Tax=Pontibacillus marinus BH030004 = DSM 16465 TaxID=1385511 RepID=A0A0A5FYK4_9BACI|nr:2'-5' RNA ligase family protein [Pontibacillus marinus]KGX84879.1 hypothetical protein N783_15830 [Pontibacillus marinus BH030004 = DSM 16465]
MYAVVGYFGPQTEEQIQAIWKDLSEQGISDYAYRVGGNRPHITFAGYDEVDESSFITDLESYYNDKEAVDVEMNVLGTFIGSSTLFITPIMTKELLNFHCDHHEAFHSYQDNPESLYQPGKWIPHCTIANYLDGDALQQAFDYCSKQLTPLKATIQEISLIKVVREEGEVKEAVNLFSVTLK